MSMSTAIDVKDLIRKAHAKDREYILDTLNDRDLHELLAEECSELAQASLKMIRASGCTHNVTPISFEKARQKVIEEAGDVLMLLDALNILPETTLDNSKWSRWRKRIEDAML